MGDLPSYCRWILLEHWIYKKDSTYPGVFVFVDLCGTFCGECSLSKTGTGAVLDMTARHPFADILEIIGHDFNTLLTLFTLDQQEDQVVGSLEGSRLAGVGAPRGVCGRRRKACRRTSRRCGARRKCSRWPCLCSERARRTRPRAPCS